MHEVAMSALLFHSLGTVAMMVGIAALSCRRVNLAGRIWVPVDAAATQPTAVLAGISKVDSKELLPRAA